MSKPKPTAVLLASGGLDSTTLAYWLRDRQIVIQPLFINYGQHCAETELSTLSSVMPTDIIRTEIVNVADVYRHSGSRLIQEADLWHDKISADDLYLPYRSLMLLTIGAAYAQSMGCQLLYAGFINSNHAKEIDCSARFFEQLVDVFDGYGGVKVQMPFRDMTKYEVARLAITMGVPIGRTFSCQASATAPCGACPNCVDRLDALKALS